MPEVRSPYHGPRSTKSQSSHHILEPHRIVAQGRLRMAASLPAMIRHLQTLAADLDVKVRKKVYKYEQWQRRCDEQPECYKIRGDSQMLAKSEAGLDLQSMILQRLVQAEDTRKRSRSDRNTSIDPSGTTEQLLQELLVTTFTQGI